MSEVLVGADEPRAFRHSPYLMLESQLGDMIYMNRHYTDAHREHLEMVAANLSALCEEEYFVVEHTFTFDCDKCKDSVPTRGFRGN